ncbi:T9SS type A sorting domain-containing protein [bacterium]|nr:T9SS type A sorting domain-containing protein [bacterium]MBU1635720.1 T9SS type A sorting domain-containing protein [bacterium]MBU1872635.1 T9SS type A sorting domain-containing protein [bacterium]
MLKRIFIKLNVCVFVFSLFVSSNYSQSLENNFFTVSMGNTAAANSYKELDTAFNMLTELGCNYTKCNFNWSRIEPLPGNYYWEETDSVALLVQQYGISIIAFVPQVGTPFWARKPGSMAGVPNNPQDFTHFIYQILNRYKDSMSIEYVEILNEISNGTSNGIEPPFAPLWDTTAVYAAEVTTAVYDTVHAHFPDVKVSSASVTQPHGLGDSMTAEDTVKTVFMDAYFSANPQFDYLSLHDYPHYGPSETGDFEYATQYNFSNLYRGLLNNYGYANKPIFVTEGALGLGPGVNEQLYAAFLAQNCIVYYSKKDSTNIISLVKASLANALAGTIGFNIADVSTGERYPAFYAFKTLKEKLEQYPEFDGRVDGQPDELYYWALKFKDENDNSLFVAFAPIQIYYPNPEQPTPREFHYTEPQSLMLEVGLNKQALITQLYGDTTTVYSDNNGHIFFEVYKEAIFIEMQSTGTSVEEETDGMIPGDFHLYQNYPNPFNPQTTISYQLPVFSEVSLKVYDILGQEVRTLVNENNSAGYHSVVWNGTDNSGRQVSSGVYFYYLKAGDEFSQTKKLLLIK